MASQQGKFIVIDGTDGSGKGTQTKLLAERLTRAGFNVEVVDFPQYGKKSAGPVEKYLNGKYGKADEVGPYRASIFYACDRYDASFKIKKWINEGKIVISNRYVTANMGHQGGKIKDPIERKHYFNWLYALEYEIFGIPKPDLNIILHVDAAIAQNLIDKKEAREYIGGKKRDIHEDDLDHLKNAEKVYLEIAKTFPGFAFVECTKNGDMIPVEEISDILWQTVMEVLNGHEPKNEQKNETSKQFWDSVLNQNQSDRAEIILNRDDAVGINFKKVYDNVSIPVSVISEKDENILVFERVSPAAKEPTRAHASDAGLDLYAFGNYSIPPKGKEVLRTGIKMAIPDGHVGLIWDKSGIAKTGLHTTGGVIDSGYRGEILINIVNLSEDIIHIAHGQKIAQILIQKIEAPKIVEGEISSDTERGIGGFGSTGLF